MEFNWEFVFKGFNYVFLELGNIRFSFRMCSFVLGELLEMMLKIVFYIFGGKGG